jgi:hypothetical protein
MRTLLLVTGNPDMDRTDLSKADRLRAGELEKRLDVAIIRRSDRFQISRACFAFFDEIGRTPGKRRTAKLRYEYVCDQAGMSPVAVRKRMNEHKSMVEPKSYLVGRVCPALDPIANVTEPRHEPVSDFVDWNDLGSCWISPTPSASLVTFLPDWPHTGVATANNPSTRASTNSRT